MSKPRPIALSALMYRRRGSMCMSDRMARRSAARPTRRSGRTLVARLQPLSPCLVVLEASGGYEGVVAAALAEAGLPVAIVNPRQVRKFAGAIGRLAKTDAIDAAVIAHFAQAVRPPARPLPDDLSLRLAELMARRRQLVVMINAEKQRLRAKLATGSRNAPSRPCSSAWKPSGRASTRRSTS